MHIGNRSTPYHFKLSIVVLVIMGLLLGPFYQFHFHVKHDDSANHDNNNKTLDHYIVVHSASLYSHNAKHDTIDDFHFHENLDHHSSFEINVSADILKRDQNNIFLSPQYIISSTIYVVVSKLEFFSYYEEYKNRFTHSRDFLGQLHPRAPPVIT